MYFYAHDCNHYYNVNKNHDYKITKYDVLHHKHGGYQG